MAPLTPRRSGWAWVWFGLWAVFAFLPLLATLDFSLRALKGVLSFEAYRAVFADPGFWNSLLFSFQMAALTIAVPKGAAIAASNKGCGWPRSKTRAPSSVAVT